MGIQVFFIDSLTIPAVEVIKISLPGSLVPHLVSMFSRSHEPSRLQKLAFCTIPLQAGGLSALLNLVPRLIELDISVPPMADILRLIECEGEVILVPMLRALYMHDMHDMHDYLSVACFKILAQVRCELGGKDSEDAIKSSLASRNTLDMLRIIFDSTKNQLFSQIILNNWIFTPIPGEDEAADMFFRWHVRLSNLFKDTGDGDCIPHHDNYLGMLDEFFTCIELCEAITINVLRMTDIHIDLRRIVVEDWLTIPGQDRFKQRAMDILDEWEQLLLNNNNLDDYCWARVTSPFPPRPCDYLSLGYVPKDKRHALRMASDSDALSIVYGLKLEHPFEETLWHRGYEGERRTF